MSTTTMDTTTTRERWYERAAWIYFAVISGAVLPLAVVTYFAPGSATDLWARFGHELPVSVAGDVVATEYVEFVSHWAITQTVGFDLFGLLVAVTAFRRGERWAWVAFCFWPVLFITHFFAYESSFRYAQLVWVALSLAALAATYPKAWARRRSLGSEAVATA